MPIQMRRACFFHGSLGRVGMLCLLLDRILAYGSMVQDRPARFDLPAQSANDGFTTTLILGPIGH